MIGGDLGQAANVRKENVGRAQGECDPQDNCAPGANSSSGSHVGHLMPGVVDMWGAGAVQHSPPRSPEGDLSEILRDLRPLALPAEHHAEVVACSATAPKGGLLTAANTGRILVR